MQLGTDPTHLYVLKEVRLPSDKAHCALALKEVQLLRSLSTPYIVAFHSAWVDGQKLSIVMEYIDGGDVAQLISRRRRLHESDALRIFGCVVAALSHMHAAHCLHRDVKPANVFISRDGGAKLGDLGVARQLDSTQALATTFIGSPLYMAPEVLGGRHYGAAADVWGAGAMLYEMLVGTPPLAAPDIAAIARAGVGQTPAALAALAASLGPNGSAPVPSALRPLLTTLLSLDPAIRPSTAHVLAHPLVAAALPPIAQLPPLARAHAAAPSARPAAVATPRVDAGIIDGNDAAIAAAVRDFVSDIVARRGAAVAAEAAVPARTPVQELAGARVRPAVPPSPPQPSSAAADAIARRPRVAAPRSSPQAEVDSPARVQLQRGNGVRVPADGVPLRPPQRKPPAPPPPPHRPNDEQQHRRHHRRHGSEGRRGGVPHRVEVDVGGAVGGRPVRTPSPVAQRRARGGPVAAPPPPNAAEPRSEMPPVTPSHETQPSVALGSGAERSPEQGIAVLPPQDRSHEPHRPAHAAKRATQPPRHGREVGPDLVRPPRPVFSERLRRARDASGALGGQQARPTEHPGSHAPRSQSQPQRRGRSRPAAAADTPASEAAAAAAETKRRLAPAAKRGNGAREFVAAQRQRLREAAEAAASGATALGGPSSPADDLLISSPPQRRSTRAVLPRRPGSPPVEIRVPRGRLRQPGTVEGGDGWSLGDMPSMATIAGALRALHPSPTREGVAVAGDPQKPSATPAPEADAGASCASHAVGPTEVDGDADTGSTAVVSVTVARRRGSTRGSTRSLSSCDSGDGADALVLDFKPLAY